MAKRKLTPESALASACALIAEHHTVAAVVVWDTKPSGEPYARWIPLGPKANAESLLSIAATHGLTAEEAAAPPPDGDECADDD
jgi:hypothetical protein